ncbi:MAG: hypothetical protein KDD61_06470 [Bdellovibrionales bacterium]|nr:hypothetical protein [Bdellovibrionales bacterium]
MDKKEALGHSRLQTHFRPSDFTSSPWADGILAIFRHWVPDKFGLRWVHRCAPDSLSTPTSPLLVAFLVLKSTDQILRKLSSSVQKVSLEQINSI